MYANLLFESAEVSWSFESNISIWDSKSITITLKHDFGLYLENDNYTNITNSTQIHSDLVTIFFLVKKRGQKDKLMVNELM